MTEEDMFRYAINYLGISLFDYYEMTPHELKLMIQGHEEKYRNDWEMYANATKIAIINGMNGKNYPVFSKDKDINLIDKETKKKELEQLKETFA